MNADFLNSWRASRLSWCLRAKSSTRLLYIHYRLFVKARFWQKYRAATGRLALLKTAEWPAHRAAKPRFLCQLDLGEGVGRR